MTKPHTDFSASKEPAGFTTGSVVVSSPDYRVSPLDPDSADQGHPSAPGRSRIIAAHEAGHCVGAVWLLGSVRAASIREGRGHLGVTFLGDCPADTREMREKAIVVALLGDAAELHFGLLEDDWSEDSLDQRAATEASAALDRLTPLGRAALLEAEADEIPHGDESNAADSAQLLDGFDAYEAQAHLLYLRTVAEGFVRRHVHAIRAVAQALLVETVLDGDEIAAIVHGSRCVCHGWTPPTERSTSMPRSSRKPDQLAPDVSSDGYQIVLPKELTVDHSHCRVARTGFWAGFLTLPGGRTTLGRTWIAEGQLVDDRDPVVRRYHRNLRKPRAADRVA